MDNLPPLLITASLDPGRTPQVALSDVRERTLRHMEGLLAWLKEPGVKKVVFAKNCALSIRVEVLVETAVSHGKELEFVQVASSPRTLIQGKGYGEGDMIRQVLKKSDVLRTSREFIKVTGKLFMPNAVSVFTGVDRGAFFQAEASSSEKSVCWLRNCIGPGYESLFCGRMAAFMKQCRVPWSWIAALPAGVIDTRCYMVEKSFYEEKLILSHARVWDSLGYTLENAFYDDLNGLKRIRFLNENPIILGASGSLGTVAGKFPNSILQHAKELADALLPTAIIG
jgi:hypothetical protein